ncbi:hypothetical protein KR222_002278, partial [Zaprionus bogoriensis]
MLHKAGSKQFKCEQCHYSSNRSFDLRRHKQRHTKVKPVEGDVFTCDVCAFSTKWKRNMGRHMRTHAKQAEQHDEEQEEEETFEEIIVELIDASESQQSLEDAATEGDAEELLPVPASEEQEQLGSSTRKEQRMKVFICGQCHYSSSRAFDLRRHEQTHERPKVIEGTAFQCIKCPYITKWKRNIKRHVEKHVQLCQQLDVLNEDELSSEEVIVDLINSHELRAEIELEPAESVSSELQASPAASEAEQQQEQLLQQQELSPQPTPEISESGEKRYRCAQCKYVSKRAFDLRRHERRHTRVKVVDGTAVKCPECSFVTKWKRNMRRHMQQHQ